MFFIADLLALHIDHSFRHYEDEAKPKPECIYDFGWNKTGVDIGMRSSLICPTCIKRIGEKNWDPLVVDAAVLILGILAFTLSCWLNLRDYRSHRYSGLH